MSPKKKIVDARQNADGDISHVRFAGNTSFTPIESAVRMADKGQIEDAHSVHPQGRAPYLRTNPDGKKQNNLDTLAGN